MRGERLRIGTHVVSFRRAGTDGTRRSGTGEKPDRRAPYPLRSLTTTVATTTGGEDAMTD
ncbi:Protein of unknown function [Micromonospora lupini str. Lupac 08]|uniref:Uncharacterized protein n=1 Tax=Micromonospora lupini str. Lupac 08 TaxID=1150864 RepID=I0KY67_9ACTN|nr:Protein of unknown function [Micromonospora lupini str. Lupac 08]